MKNHPPSLQRAGRFHEFGFALDEIARWIGCRPEILIETVREYNEGCKNGHDTIFGKDRIYLLPLIKAPYYAIKGQSSICDTIGGIKINEKIRKIKYTIPLEKSPQ